MEVKGIKTHGANLGRFVFCSTGICVCYWLYGIMQENLFSNSELGATFMLLSQAAANILVAIIWQHIQSILEDGKDRDVTSKASKSLNHPLLIITSAFYVFAMMGSNEALRFVPYPTAVLAKSCKLLPTMLMGVLIERRVYSLQQWASALAISAGMSLFHLSRIHDKKPLIEDETDQNDNNDDDDDSWKGMILLMGSLTCDGFLGSCQGILKRKDVKGIQRPPSAVETMLYTNLYALLYLIPFALLTGQWSEGIYLLQHDADLRLAMIVLNGVVSVGQIFIFITLTSYSSLVCTTITTTRKFFTILLSVIYFGHHFSGLQWCAVGLVFSGLYLATMSKQVNGHKQEKTRKIVKKTQ